MFKVMNYSTKFVVHFFKTQINIYICRISWYKCLQQITHKRKNTWTQNFGLIHIPLGFSWNYILSLHWTSAGWNVVSCRTPNTSSQKPNEWVKQSIMKELKVCITTWNLNMYIFTYCKNLHPVIHPTSTYWFASWKVDKTTGDVARTSHRKSLTHLTNKQGMFHHQG